MTFERAFLRTLVLVTGLCLADCDPPPEVRSLRLMLYNVKFVADGDDVNDVVFENDKARAEHIVARIDGQLAELDPDIIVFNEAFDEEAQDVFSSGLCDTHPFFSRFIDEEDDDQHQDSGLMLFSRHPFAPLNLTEADFEARDHLTFTGCVDADADEDDPAYWDDIGFQLYLNCNYVFEDCSANKGIAAARFSHRSTGELFNILFTHLQSGGGDGERETRVHQMADIRELVEAVPDWETQRTFILGDVDGVTASWTSQSVVGTSSRWFFFDTDVSETGARPEIDIHVEGVCTAGFEAFLYDEDGNTVPWTSVEVGNVPTTLTASADDLPSGRYRVEVHRVDNGDQAPCTMNVQYLTTLTYLRFGTLVCADETGGSGGPAEEIGHDEIWHRFDLDGSYPNGSCLTSTDLGEFSHLRDFDEDDAKTLNLDGKLGQRVYVDCWLLELLEADDVSEGDVQHLNDDERVFTLDREQRTDTRDLKWDAGDYEYRLRYTLSHEPDPK